MSSSTGRRIVAKALAGITAVALGAIGSTLILAGPAGAATTVDGQLSLSGIATPDNPLGGATVGLHPGDSITLKASTLPTAGLDKLGLGSLVTGVVDLLAKYQVDANFSSLPGGAKSTVLSGKQTKTFTFPKAGTYNFTWEAQSVGLLGVVPINLNGNQLAKAGIELNAHNQYVGKIVVAANPPKGGLGLQLPGVSVQPKVGPVTLPKVSLPGLTTPTIPVSVPDLTTVTGGGGKTAGKPGSTSTGKTSGTTPQKSVLPIPAQVVPQGTGTVVGDTSGYSASSGDFSALPSLSFNNSTFGTPAIAKTAGKAKPKALNSAGKDNTVTLAASRPASTSGMPVILAVVSILALVLVAGTYARLFLLRKPTS